MAWVRIWICVIAVCCLVGLQANAASSTTVRLPPTNVSNTRNPTTKLVVLGDLHGDLDYLQAILRFNGVLNGRDEWIDETTTVVSVGDTIGRGHQDKQMLEFIKSMSEKHNWLQQLGNHEIMQLRGDFRYAVDGDGIGFGSLEAREEALEKGSVLGDWLRSLPAIRQVGDNVFIHAGMSDPYNIGRSMAAINDEIAEFLKVSEPRHVYDDLIWSRTLVQDAYERVPGTCEVVASVLEGFPGAARLFIGHTPVQSSSLTGTTKQTDPLIFCDDTLYDIDVGISRWMYANPVNLQLVVDDAGRTVRFETLRTPIDGAGAPLVNVTGEEEEMLTQPVF
eukprot:m.104037 g.104037  ORF g.104037 m.104037 type:complete len:335 (+) comp27546_c1_seq3:154-1158(+)